MKYASRLLFVLICGGLCAVSCADTATCFPDEVLVEGRCLPRPPQASGGESAGPGGSAFAAALGGAGSMLGGAGGAS